MAVIAANASVFDQRSLAGLRTAGGDEQALEHAAAEFEALFLRMMLKSMRDAMPSSPLTGSSNHLRDYQDMHDAQLAAHLARSGGVGLADVIARQMRPRGASAPAAHSVERALRAYRGNDLSAPALSPEQQRFVDQVRPHAIAAARRLRTDPETIIAQAALETGWGRSGLAKQNSYFGVKASPGWAGTAAVAPTTEFQGDQGYGTKAAFRTYPDAASSFADYASLVGDSERYSAALGRRGKPYFQALKDGGYATDPRYVEKAHGVYSQLKFGSRPPIEPQTARFARMASMVGASDGR